jgi:flagellar biosynthesis regulator FlbT
MHNDVMTKTSEKTKKEIADQVITPKRRYYFPQQGKSVEAESREAANKLVEETKEEEDGDDSA